MPWITSLKCISTQQLEALNGDQAHENEKMKSNKELSSSPDVQQRNALNNNNNNKNSNQNNNNHNQNSIENTKPRTESVGDEKCLAKDDKHRFGSSKMLPPDDDRILKEMVKMRFVVVYFQHLKKTISLSFDCRISRLPLPRPWKIWLNSIAIVSMHHRCMHLAWICRRIRWTEMRSIWPQPRRYLRLMWTAMSIRWQNNWRNSKRRSVTLTHWCHRCVVKQSIVIQIVKQLVSHESMKLGQSNQEENEDEKNHFVGDILYKSQNKPNWIVFFLGVSPLF